MTWYIAALSNYAVFSGRARRLEYWMFTLTSTLILCALAIVDVGMGGDGGLPGLYALAVFLPSMAVAVRRLHDTGRSGFWVCLGILPIIGSILLLVFLLQDSSADWNHYGSNPKDPRSLNDPTFSKYPKYHRPRSRLNRMPLDHPDLGSQADDISGNPVGEESYSSAPQQLPEAILGSWRADGASGSIELSFTMSEYLLIRDALEGVASGPYKVVSGPEPAYELEFPETSPSIRRISVRPIPDGRLHVVGEGFEWVLSRPLRDRANDATKAASEFFRRKR
jgi:uncharacterized membrane protein YhaH (DUF805 family)